MPLAMPVTRSPAAQQAAQQMVGNLLANIGQDPVLLGALRAYRRGRAEARWCRQSEQEQAALGDVGRHAREGVSDLAQACTSMAGRPVARRVIDAPVARQCPSRASQIGQIGPATSWTRRSKGNLVDSLRDIATKSSSRRAGEFGRARGRPRQGAGSCSLPSRHLCGLPQVPPRCRPPRPAPTRSTPRNLARPPTRPRPALQQSRPRRPDHPLARWEDFRSGPTVDFGCHRQPRGTPRSDTADRKIQASPAPRSIERGSAGIRRWRSGVAHHTLPSGLPRS